MAAALPHDRNSQRQNAEELDPATGFLLPTGHWGPEQAQGFRAQMGTRSREVVYYSSTVDPGLASCGHTGGQTGLPDKPATETGTKTD